MTLVPTYGAWGGLPITAKLSSGLTRITDKRVTPLSLAGHDGETFTPAMGGWSLEDYQADILAQLPEGDITLVSHSMTAVCAYRIAQEHPDKIKGVVMIDPPMLGGVSDWRVGLTFLRKPKLYLCPLFKDTPFNPTREDAKMMLFNGMESPHLDLISKQPASGKAIRQMVTSWLPRKKTIVPCAVIVAKRSRLHPAWPKKFWARSTGSIHKALDESHCGILENAELPGIVSDIIQQWEMA